MTEETEIEKCNSILNGILLLADSTLLRSMSKLDTIIDILQQKQTNKTIWTANTEETINEKLYDIRSKINALRNEIRELISKQESTENDIREEIEKLTEKIDNLSLTGTLTVQ